MSGFVPERFAAMAPRAWVQSLRGPKAIDRAFFGADYEISTAHGRRGADRAIELNPLEFFTAREIKGVQPPVLRTHIHAIPSDDRRAIDLAVGRQAPHFFAGRSIERVDALIAATGNDEL